MRSQRGDAFVGGVGVTVSEDACEAGTVVWAGNPWWTTKAGVSFLRAASAPFPKFVIRRSKLRHELRKQRGTSNAMILVPPFDLKFLTELAAGGVGTSNRRH